LYTPEIAELGQRTAKGMIAYAKRHGYGAVIETARIDASRPASWSKLLLIERYLLENPACDWLMWIDADALVTNPQRRLEELVDDNVDFVVAQDLPPGNINAGVFLIRNGPAAVEMLRRAYGKTQYVHHPCWEQPALAEALAECADTIRTRVVARRHLNAFASVNEHQKGDFVIHFAGLSPEAKLAALKKAMRQGTASLEPTKSAALILLVGFYEDADANRRHEFLECLRRNIDNDHFDEIHVFVEERRSTKELSKAYPLLTATKIRLVSHRRRVRYRALFEYANRRLPRRRVVIANADIFFDHTLEELVGSDLRGRLLCLSRWDVQPDGMARFFEHPGSQDAWIFETPIRKFFCDFPLGVPDCDRRLAWEAERAGLALSNPSRTLRAIHLHLSQVRRYDEHQRLTGSSKFVPASFLKNIPRRKYRKCARKLT
jgi:hypothetical protein